MKYNSELQREAKKEVNKIKKQNAKLRNNSKFGKLIENPVKKVDVKVVATRKKHLKWSFTPFFKNK